LTSTGTWGFGALDGPAWANADDDVTPMPAATHKNLNIFPSDGRENDAAGRLLCGWLQTCAAGFIGSL
jgi:hypothetical protein